MRPLAIAAVLPTLLFLMLSSCGKGSEEFIQNGPTTYSVSAEYGATMGGWDRAKDEATAKATQFMAAIKKCTDGLKFDSDRYVACMSKEGESP